MLTVETEGKYATMGSAGFDLSTSQDVTIEPGETKVIDTHTKIVSAGPLVIQVKPGAVNAGISATLFAPEEVWSIPVPYLRPELQIRPRSSLSKRGILCHFGTVDADYRDIICAILTNLSKEVVVLKAGSRIAQAVCAYTFQPAGAECAGAERTGGFGSTGV